MSPLLKELAKLVDLITSQLLSTKLVCPVLEYKHPNMSARRYNNFRPEQRIPAEHESMADDESMVVSKPSPNEPKPMKYEHGKKSLLEKENKDTHLKIKYNKKGLVMARKMIILKIKGLKMFLLVCLDQIVMGSETNRKV